MSCNRMNPIPFVLKPPKKLGEISHRSKCNGTLGIFLLSENHFAPIATRYSVTPALVFFLLYYCHIRLFKKIRDSEIRDVEISIKYTRSSTMGPKSSYRIFGEWSFESQPIHRKSK